LKDKLSNHCEVSAGGGLLDGSLKDKLSNHKEVARCAIEEK